MRLLAIESAGGAAGAALLSDGEVLAEEWIEESLAEGRLLVPLIDRLVARAGSRPSDLDVVAVDLGPGSFTGIRIGVSIAKSLSFALRIPVIGLDRFDLAAFQAGETLGDFAPVVDTRRGAVACAFFRRAAPGEAAVRLSADLSLSPEELARRIEESGGPLTLFGSGVEACREALSRFTDLRFAPAELALVRPGTVARLAALVHSGRDLSPLSGHQILDSSQSDALAPIYLRKTAAEERLARGSPA
ncbi:MAG: tRNA (adenosine(37)-N6)-threonylcarbamoyltransferase complex dimerization subunit type 1 TsaB [Planctomycetes bacterium]|nr:tRNA (adenosine(37)-N6)-threonylcarbamoyltransferase complex dimerization subunit type 1 TsaB [Planctomycetota bacterium]